MVTGEATIIVPQIIQQSLISLTVVDLPDPVINKAKVNKEIIEIKEDRDLPIDTAVWRCNPFDNYF